MLLASCGQGEPTTLATGQQPVAIGLDATHVYWLNVSGTLMRCPTTGVGGAPTTLATNQSSPFAIAVDATHAYWANAASPAGPGSIVKCAVADCAGTQTVVAAQTNATGLAIDGSYVYWTNGDAGTIMRCPLDGCAGAPTVLISSQAWVGAIVTDRANLYWLATLPPFGENPTSLRKASIDGTNIVTLATDLAGPHGFIVAHGRLFSSSNDEVLSCATTGCDGRPIVLARAQEWPGGIAADTTDVFWTNAGESSPTPRGTVMKCKVGGCDGQPTIVASGQSAPVAITVDATTIYWANLNDGGNGTIMKMAK